MCTFVYVCVFWPVCGRVVCVCVCEFCVCVYTHNITVIQMYNGFTMLSNYSSSKSVEFVKYLNCMCVSVACVWCVFLLLTTCSITISGNTYVRILCICVCVFVCNLTTARYYIESQRPSPSVDGWYMIAI